MFLVAILPLLFAASPVLAAPPKAGMRSCETLLAQTQPVAPSNMGTRYQLSWFFGRYGKAYREAATRGNWSKRRAEAFAVLGLPVGSLGPDSHFVRSELPGALELEVALERLFTVFRVPQDARILFRRAYYDAGGKVGSTPYASPFPLGARPLADSLGDVGVLRMLARNEHPIGANALLLVHDLAHAVSFALFPRYARALIKGARRLLRGDPELVDKSDALSTRLNWVLEQMNMLRISRGELEGLLELPSALRGRKQVTVDEVAARYKGWSGARLQAHARLVLGELPRIIEAIGGLDADNLTIGIEGGGFEKNGLEPTSLLHAWDALGRTAMRSRPSPERLRQTLARVETYLLQVADLTPEQLTDDGMRATLKKGSALERLICASGFLRGLPPSVDFGCP